MCHVYLGKGRVHEVEEVGTRCEFLVYSIGSIS
jgi:hypothetical protein